MLAARTGEIPEVWLYPFVLPCFRPHASISSCLRCSYVCILIFFKMNYECLLLMEVASFHEHRAPDRFPGTSY